MAYGYVKDGTCGSCRYYSYEGSNSKGYCSYFRSYYYDNDSCSHWEEGNVSSGSGGCFVTTACCQHKGLPDNCRELEILRGFRDGYLKEQPYGIEMVRLYYKDAPELVKMINARPDRAEIYENLYQKVQEIVRLVENKSYESAIIEYLFMLYKLKCMEQQ